MKQLLRFELQISMQEWRTIGEDIIEMGWPSLGFSLHLRNFLPTVSMKYCKFNVIMSRYFEFGTDRSYMNKKTSMILMT